MRSWPSQKLWECALVASPLLAILLSHLWFVPLWDGMEYAQCVVGALRPGHALGELNCFGHPTLAYTAPLALAAKVAYGSYVPFILVNAALSLLALFSFLRLCEWLLPGDEHRVERLLAGILVSCSPCVVSAALNLTPDYAVFVFLLATAAALVGERPVAASLLGTALVLSKETGTPIYCLLVALAWLLFARRRPTPLQALLAVFPLMALVAVKVWQTKQHQTGWAGAKTGSLLDLAFQFRFDRGVQAYLFAIFCFQFQWLATGLGLLALSRLRDRRVQFVLALLVGVVYTATRFVSFINVRYLVYAVPVLMLAALAGSAAIRSALVRRALLGGAVAASALSLVAPVDPLSRAFFGTFDFGRRELFRMTSYTGEGAGYGRDQLVYNLQFVALDRVLDQALRDLKPSMQAPMVLPSQQDWFVLQQIDPANHSRTLRPPDDPALPYGETQRALRPDRPWISLPWLIRSGARPQRLFFVALPNGPLAPDLATLARKYDLVGTHEYDWHGYTLQVAELALR